MTTAWNIVELAIRQYAKRRLNSDTALDPDVACPTVQVAKALGVPYRTLKRWQMDGVCRPRGDSHQHVKALAIGSGVDLACLLP